MKTADGRGQSLCFLVPAAAVDSLRTGARDQGFFAAGGCRQSRGDPARVAVGVVVAGTRYNKKRCANKKTKKTHGSLWTLLKGAEGPERSTVGPGSSSRPCPFHGISMGKLPSEARDPER